MLTKLKTTVFSVLLILPLCSYAQKFDSAIRLHSVLIEQSRLGNYAISKYTLKIDSLTRQLAGASNLADLMRKYGYGHMRTYGPGGLSTASFRGTGSSHTVVLWNGINLLSPLAGQLDLTHVPVSFIDDASIQTGGAASLYGNGSIGATIRLNNKASFNEGLKLNTYASAGSFGAYYQDLGATWSGKKFITSTKVFANHAANYFPFLNKDVYPFKEERRVHSALHQKGLLQQNYWQPSAHHLFTFKFWYQDNTYETPNPTSVPRDGQAVEKNKFYRTLAGWHYTHHLFEINYQGAFIRHALDYTDPSSNTISNSTFNTFINNIESNYNPFRNTHATSGFNYTWEEGLVADYGSTVPKRNRFAIFDAIKWTPVSPIDVSFAFREELVNGKTTPVAPSITAKARASQNIEVYGSISRNYRIPTFNDLYWKGAGGVGNPNLKAETSVSDEVGFSYTTSPNSSTTSFSIKSALFNNKVNNWILWSPITAAIWSPLNVEKVWSRGIETQASARRPIGNITVQLMMQYTFTRSTAEDIYNTANSNELHKQLTFTPMQEGSATGRVYWKSYSVNIITSYTGKQYTDGDNNDFNAMKSYAITSLWLNKAVTSKKIKAALMGEVNNILNVAYQGRPGYPMPGRNYKLGVTINFNNQSKL